MTLAAETTSTTTAAEAPVRWFAWKRYILIVVALVILVMILPSALGESDQWTHIPDDVIISAMAIALIAVVMVYWKSFPLRSQPAGRRWAVTVMIVALLGQVAGFALEYTDPNDVGNEYIGFALIAVAVAVAIV